MGACPMCDILTTSHSLHRQVAMGIVLGRQQALFEGIKLIEFKWFDAMVAWLSVSDNEQKSGPEDDWVCMTRRMVL